MRSISLPPTRYQPDSEVDWRHLKVRTIYLVSEAQINRIKLLLKNGKRSPLKTTDWGELVWRGWLEFRFLKAAGKGTRARRVSWSSPPRTPFTLNCEGLKSPFQIRAVSSWSMDRRLPASPSSRIPLPSASGARSPVYTRLTLTEMLAVILCVTCGLPPCCTIWSNCHFLTRLRSPTGRSF